MLAWRALRCTYRTDRWPLYPQEETHNPKGVSVVYVTMPLVDRDKLEAEWNAILRARSNDGRARIYEHELVLHDLFVTGEIRVGEVVMIARGKLTFDDLMEQLDETSLLTYKCILCHDTGCEFCPGVE